MEHGSYPIGTISVMRKKRGIVSKLGFTALLCQKTTVIGRSKSDSTHREWIAEKAGIETARLRLFYENEASPTPDEIARLDAFFNEEMQHVTPRRIYTRPGLNGSRSLWEKAQTTFAELFKDVGLEQDVNHDAKGRWAKKVQPEPSGHETHLG